MVNVCSTFLLVLPEVNISRNENNSNMIDCIVRANPSPEISWKECVENGTKCKLLKQNFEKKEIGYGIYKSNISLEMSSSNVFKCEAKNKLGNAKNYYRRKVVGQIKGEFFVLDRDYSL